MFQECWETAIGQKVYRLIIIDFLIVTVFGAVLRCIRFIIYRFVWKPIGISSFNISHGCLGLILNQTLLWIGLFFSPLLAAVIILKMIATFYLKVIHKHISIDSYYYLKFEVCSFISMLNFCQQKIVLIRFCKVSVRLLGVGVELVSEICMCTILILFVFI